MEEISGHGWDLSKSTGTALHQSQKIAFDSLRKIRAAYSHAFNNELDYVFDTLPALIRAEKIRHLFAHRGGLIDRKFKDDLSAFDDCKELVIGDRLRLTGPITGQLFDACVRCGTELLVATDKWSQTHYELIRSGKIREN